MQRMLLIVLCVSSVICAQSRVGVYVIGSRGCGAEVRHLEKSVVEALPSGVEVVGKKKVKGLLERKFRKSWRRAKLDKKSRAKLREARIDVLVVVGLTRRGEDCYNAKVRVLPVGKGREERKKFYKTPITLAEIEHKVTSMLRRSELLGFSAKEVAEERRRVAEERHRKEQERIAKSTTSSDGRYRVYRDGMIYDRKNGLEWYVGPDKNTNWDQAKSWVASLSVDGGGWRMPTTDELEGIYEKGKVTGKAKYGDYIHLDPVFKTAGGSWVWTGKLLNRYSFDGYAGDAYGFTFIGGYGKTKNLSDGGGGNRGFAVRAMEAEQKARERRREAEERHRKEQERIAKTTASFDGRYRVYRDGMIYDSKTGLEWYVGPDKDTGWDQAKSWVESLSIDGGGWRMPTTEELKGIYEKGKVTGKTSYGDSIHLDPVFKTTGEWIWSEIERDSPACAFSFYFGPGSEKLDVRDRRYTYDGRGFAVRLKYWWSG